MAWIYWMLGAIDLAPRERTPRSDTLIALGGPFMSRITRRSYTDEFKHQAVALAESLGPAAAARQLEMSVKTLANWVDAVRAGRSLTSEARRPATDLESEISRLRAENANLRMEREILKKAAAFFAKESK
jgi:transposase